MNNSYRILIAEDDALISESLCNHLEDLGHEVIGIVSDITSAIEYLEQKPDFCFLDIRMHGKDTGFEIAKIIHEKYKIPFLFLTSFSDKKTVLEAGNYGPSAYLIKPFKSADIFSSLEVAMAKVNAEKAKKLKLKVGHNVVLLDPSEILWVKADNVYIEIQTQDKRHIVRTSLDKFKEELPAHFIRCHRSFLVNMNIIDSSSASQIFVGETRIPISRSYRDSVKEFLK